MKSLNYLDTKVFAVFRLQDNALYQTRGSQTFLNLRALPEWMDAPCLFVKHHLQSPPQNDRFKRCRSIVVTEAFVSEAIGESALSPATLWIILVVISAAGDHS